MGFLRRLFGGAEEGRETEGAEGADATPSAGPDAADAAGAAHAGDTVDPAGAAVAVDTSGAADPADPADLDAEERARELELARQEAARLDELQQRQLRFADYAWTPPAQGGGRRADDEDRPADG